MFVGERSKSRFKGAFMIFTIQKYTSHKFGLVLSSLIFRKNIDCVSDSRH